MSDSDDELRDQFPVDEPLMAMAMAPEEQAFLLQLLHAKNGLPSTMPSAFLEDELFEEPYTIEEIKADPAKHILWAAEHNKLEEVENLLRSDSSLIQATDEDKYTALHRAAYNGHNDMVKLLVANSADINARTADGWQPFHSACRWDNVQTAQLLIQLGADVHSVTNGNNTALHLASSNSEAESMIKFLLNQTDIDVTVTNKSGDTAEDICRRNSSFYKHFHNHTANQRPSAKDQKQQSTSTSASTEECEARLRVVIVPGNGGGNVYRANWYGWAQRKINKSLKLECRLENMPDPVVARESVWLPFMEKELKCDENTIAIGHSSGSAAIMRYMEKHKIFAAILVSAYISDLGDANEAESGYFNRPWDWESMKQNCSNIIQFSSTDDPFLPWSEQKTVAEKTSAIVHSSDCMGHYMNSNFPELINTVKKLCDQWNLAHK